MTHRSWRCERRRHDRVAQAPARHRVPLRKPVHDHGAFRHAGERGDRVAPPVVADLPVHLVRDDPQIVALCQVRERREVARRRHTAGGVVRHIEDEHARARRDPLRDRRHVRRELPRLVERVVDRPPTREADDGLVDREPGVGAQHLVPGLDHGECRAEQRRLRPGGDHDVFGGGPHAARRQRAGDRIAQLRHPRSEGVAREAVTQRADARLHHVGRRRHVRLADLQVHDLVPRRLEASRGGEDHVGLFRTECVEPCSRVHIRSSVITKPRGESPGVGHCHPIYLPACSRALPNRGGGGFTWRAPNRRPREGPPALSPPRR